MAYFPVIPFHDDRRAKQGAVPLELVNMSVERGPPGAGKRSEFFLTTTWGRTRVATLPANLRGLFSEPGCQSGALFAAAGSAVYLVASDWTYSAIGAYSASADEVVVMTSLRQDLTALAGGSPKHWNGTTFASGTDPDIPATVSTIASVATRNLMGAAGGDGFVWSRAGLPLDVDSSSFALDIQLPDAIVGFLEINGELWSGNARSFAVWQPTALEESLAFQPVADIRDVGLAGRDLFCRVRKFGGMFLGSDRTLYATSGLGVVQLPSRDIALALRDVSDEDLAGRTCWAYSDGEKEFWGLSAGLARGYVFDADLNLIHTRERYGEDVYDVDFVTSAYGATLCAGRNSPYIWEFDPDVFTDDGDPIVRRMTFKVPSTGDVTVDRIVFDAKWRAQPLEGQGSAPTVLLSVSMDNGETWSDARELEVPGPGQKWRVQDFGFGLADAEDGCLIRLEWSDPVGAAIYGVWVNSDESEMNG